MLHLNHHRPGLRVIPCLLWLWCSCSCIVFALYPNQSRTNLFCAYFQNNKILSCSEVALLSLAGLRQRLPNPLPDPGPVVIVEGICVPVSVSVPIALFSCSSLACTRVHTRVETICLWLCFWTIKLYHQKREAFEKDASPVYLQLHHVSS